MLLPPSVVAETSGGWQEARVAQTTYDLAFYVPECHLR